MEVALLIANVLESNEETMTCFLHGLNKDIQDVVELYHYTFMDDLLHLATRVESQQRRHLASKRSHPNSPEQPIKDKSPKNGSLLPQGRKEEKILLIPVLASKSSNIKCFGCLGKGHIASQCPNKRSMILREDGTMDNKSSRDKSSSISEIGLAMSDFSPDNGDLLMVRCLMSAHVGNYVLLTLDDSDRHIFHSRCHILGKLCSIIIDGGSCVNVASLRERWKLPNRCPWPSCWGKYNHEVQLT
ncbi:hypothetical protein CR513_07489, partial [Mucuna pruriens]